MGIENSQQSFVHLTEDARCLRCSYALRGLEPSGICPECGTPIVESLQGNKLCFAAPEYVRKLHVGSFLMLTCVAAYVVMLLIGIATAIATQGEIVSFIAMPFFLFFLGVYILLLYGTWMFSTADPVYVGTDNSSTSRMLVRVCVTTIGIGQALSIGLGFIMSSRDLDVVMIPVSIAIFAAFIAIFFATQAYIKWLAMRVPDKDIAKRASDHRWLLPLLMFGPFCCTFASPILGIIGIACNCLALLLWWMNLDRLRRHLKVIRFE